MFIADGLGFADALSAGAAAGEMGGPVLLTLPDALPGVTRSELERLDPNEVVIVGGPAAISSGVEAEVEALGLWSVQRVSGPDRFATSAAVSAYAFDHAAHVYLATGLAFPDALAAAAAAGSAGSPVLLVRQTGVPSPITAELKRLLSP